MMRPMVLFLSLLLVAAAFVISFTVISNNKAEVEVIVRSRPPPRLLQIPVSNDTTTNTTIKVLDEGYLTGYLVTVSSSSTFSVQLPSNGGLSKASTQARRHDCHIAINGGPFQTNGDSIGGVVVNRTIVNNDFQPTNVGFGLTKDNSWILGGITNQTEAIHLNVDYYVTGFDWLVYNGTPATTGPGTAERAPRTSIGVTQEGQLLLFVVDGCEHCLLRRRRGLTLTELAQVLASPKVGMHHAINLDGGSSTTLVENGRIRNVPTCLDVPFECERPVSTIVCIK